MAERVFPSPTEPLSSCAELPGRVAYPDAAAGRLPPAAASESYCHSLPDSSNLGHDLAAQGYQTPTPFGLQLPA
ncbi:hypothetical protein, partial [Saccharothrix sp. ST-888]|uniref:hypothetical protein n=1 Tax=Saccharothrix sp. ST-888 TaxID=1427391 RepID=UPI001E45B95E